MQLDDRAWDYVDVAFFGQRNVSVKVPLPVRAGFFKLLIVWDPIEQVIFWQYLWTVGEVSTLLAR